MTNKCLLGFLAAGLICSCSVGPSRDILITEIASQNWSVSRPADVFYENTDTLGAKRMEVLVRFRNDFSCDRLDIVLETLSPDALIWCDTLSVPFEKKEVTETVSLTYTDIKIPYRRQSQLIRPGHYRFRFTPAYPHLRTEEVIGVGIEITPQQ